jgi:hypothetical protein
MIGAIQPVPETASGGDKRNVFAEQRCGKLSNAEVVATIVVICGR